MNLMQRVQALNDTPTTGLPAEQEAMTMRTPPSDTSQFDKSSAFNFADKSKNPMTQRPADPDADDPNVCVTAHVQAMADYMGMPVGQFLDEVQRAAVLSRLTGKNWNKVESADFGQPIKGRNIFVESAENIASHFASKKVAPGGLGQSITKLNWYLTASGVSIPQGIRTKVHKAILILHERNLKVVHGKGAK